MSAVESKCESCPAFRAGHLVRLGVDMSDAEFVVALAGNPNTGKSTVFNALTGLRQHTGNWPGKTVVRAEGGFEFASRRYKIVDLPGTYSLLSTSSDEEVARDFLLFGQPDVTVVVVDATCLERNLNLVLQVLQITDRVVVCLNLVDEAERKGITVDERALARMLGVPVVATSARYGRGIEDLNRVLHDVATGTYNCQPLRVHPEHKLKKAISTLTDRVMEAFPGIPNAQWVAIRLLDGDLRIEDAVRSGELGDMTHERSLIERPVFDSAALLQESNGYRQKIGNTLHQTLVEEIFRTATDIASKVVEQGDKKAKFDFDRKLDSLLTSRIFGFPIMLALLIGVFWLTIAGANVPSALLADLLIGVFHPILQNGAAAIGMPWWLSGLLVDGMYLSTAWVIAVMLPPMAIFFPLFTLLEDFGYLPRVAFNLDKTFAKAGAHGKQSLTMAMGFGCNAAGVVATRIIDSPRERLIAIITNNFALCNGRWPTQILIASIFLGGLVPAHLAGVVSAFAVVGVALLGVFLTFIVSWVLSRTVLKGEASTFSLELPPYRPPRVLQTIYTSLIDRTFLVLRRAVIFALPAGAVIWLVSNIMVGDTTLAHQIIGFLDPFGAVLGLSGLILLAYIVAIPANEIVIPTILMLTVLVTGTAALGHGAGVMFELDSVAATGDLLRASGWTLLTAVNLMLFSLVHNPCSTTIYTIWSETRSAKWTALAALLPLFMGFGLCFAVAQVWSLAT